jgi:hypothetical protein
MNAEPKGWDQNLKLGKGFLLTLAVVGPVVLLAIWPWLREQGTTTTIAGSILFPFLSSVAVYVLLKVFNMIFIKKEVEGRQIHAFVITLVFLVASFSMIYATKSYAENPLLSPSLVAFLAVMLYSILSGRNARH